MLKRKPKEISTLPKRTVLFHFCATEEEAAVIQQRLTESGMVSRSAYIRHMAIVGYLVTFDLTVVREMISLLRRCENNLKQLHRRATETQSIHAADIEELLQRQDKLWDAANEMLKRLAEIK